MPRISVIIPTYNGRHKIGNLLRSLEIQKYKNFETLIVIDGSIDGTLEYLQKGKWKLTDLKIISQSNCGRAQVRNRGAREASGELLIFIDDDMRMEPDAISHHMRHHKMHPESILIGNAMEDTSKCQTSIQKYKAYKSRFWGKNLEKYPDPLAQQNIFMSAANFSIGKALIIRLTGFDTTLTDGEDLEFALRSQHSDVKFYFNREILGWHDDFITANSYIKRLQDYKVSHKKILALHPEWIKLTHFAQQQNLNKFKKVLYYIFGFSFWVSAIDNFNVFIILPKGLRYKLYDLILTANSRKVP